MRFLVNHQQQQDHSLWSTHGLGLQDSGGALKRELIDLDQAQAGIDFAVSWSLHRKTEQEHLDEMPPKVSGQSFAQANTCLSQFGMCKRHKLFPVVDALARSFAKFTEEKRLPTGSLVRIKLSVAGSSGSRDALPEGTVFLGALCKKPLSHVLAKAWPSDPEQAGSACFSLFDASAPAEDRMPTFMTSHKFLLELAQSCDSAVPIKGLVVSTFQFFFEEKLASVEKLKVTCVGLPVDSEIKLGESAPPRPKVQIELPFGVKMPGKPKATSKQRATATEKPDSSKPKAFEVDSKRADELQSDSDSAGDSGGDDGSSSSESRASSSDSSDDSSGTESEPVADEAEQLVLPTPAAQVEADAVHVASKEFKKDESKRAELTAEAKKSVGSSFFTASIGFADGSIAPSGRSVCYHCDGKIAKGCPRFTYFWSRTRPSRFVHAICVVPFVQASTANRKDQAMNAMRRIKDSDEALPDGIKPAADRIFTELLDL